MGFIRAAYDCFFFHWSEARLSSGKSYIESRPKVLRFPGMLRYDWIVWKPFWFNISLEMHARTAEQFRVQPHFGLDWQQASCTQWQTIDPQINSNKAAATGAVTSMEWWCRQWHVACSPTCGPETRAPSHGPNMHINSVVDPACNCERDWHECLAAVFERLKTSLPLLLSCTSEWASAWRCEYAWIGKWGENIQKY